LQHGGNWKKSPTYLISSSYLQPLLLWTGATLICRYSSTICFLQWQPYPLDISLLQSYGLFVVWKFFLFPIGISLPTVPAKFTWSKWALTLLYFCFLLLIFLFVHATYYRGLDPVVLPTAASQAVKTRLITFMRSLSAVLAVAYILTRCTCYILKKLQVLFVSCSFIFSHAHVSYFKVVAKSITTFLDSLYRQVLKIAESIAKAHAGTTI